MTSRLDMDNLEAELWEVEQTVKEINKIIHGDEKDLEAALAVALRDSEKVAQYESMKETINCEFAPDCKEKDLRENILTHVKICPYRLIQCEYCEETMTFENLE